MYNDDQMTHLLGNLEVEMGGNQIQHEILESTEHDSYDDEDQQDFDDSMERQPSPTPHHAKDRYHLTGPHTSKFHYTGLQRDRAVNHSIKRQSTDPSAATVNLSIGNQTASATQVQGNPNHQKHAPTIQRHTRCEPGDPSDMRGAYEDFNVRGERKSGPTNLQGRFTVHAQEPDKTQILYPIQTHKRTVRDSQKHTRPATNKPGKHPREDGTPHRNRLDLGRRSPESDIPGGIQYEDESFLLDDIDYNRELLAKKPYAELENESFDFNPNVSLRSGSAEASLEEQLANGRKLPQEEKSQMFDGLTIDAWEEAGDWFMKEFEGLMKRMRETRQGKRKLAMDFERQIATRQDAVEAHDRGIEKALGEMKQGGRDILRTKHEPKEENDSEKDG